MEFSSPIGCKTEKTTNRSDENSCVSVIGETLLSFIDETSCASTVNEENPRSFIDETSCASSLIEEKPLSFIDETSCTNVIDGTPYPFGKRNSLVCCHCNLSFLNYTELVLHRRSHFSHKSYFSVLNQNIQSPSDIDGDDSKITLCNDSEVTKTSYDEPFVSTSNVVNKTDQFFVRMEGENGNEQIFAFETFEQPLERLSANCDIIINETETLSLDNITHRPQRSRREHFAESTLNYVANTPTAKSFLSKCKVTSRKLPRDRQLLYPEKYLKNLSSKSRVQRTNRKSSQKSSSNKKDGSSIITQNTEDKMNYTNYTETMSLEEETNDTNSNKTISFDEEINDINCIKPTSLEKQINNTKYTGSMSLEEQINNTKYTELMSLEEQINNTKYTEPMSLEEEFHNFETSTNETANVPVSVDETCINAATTVHLTGSQFNRSSKKSNSDSEGISFTCINAISTPKLVDEESNRQRLIDLNRSSHFSDESSYENRRQLLEDSNTVVIDDSNGYDFNESTSQLINESTSQLINESTSQLINESTSQQINESTRERINKSTSERINKSTSQRINEWMSQTINESTSEQINDSTSERIDECMSKNVNEFLYESFSSQDLLERSSGNSSHLLDYGCLDSMVIGDSDIDTNFSNNQHRSSSATNRSTEQVSDAQEYPSELDLAVGGNITGSSSLQSDSSPDFKLRKMSILEEIEARIMNQLVAENSQTQENVDSSDSENEEKFQHLISKQENVDSGDSENEEKFQHLISTQDNLDSGDSENEEKFQHLISTQDNFDSGDSENEEIFQHLISTQDNLDSSDSESVEKCQHPTDWLRQEHRRVIANWCKGEESTEFKCRYCEQVCESHDQLCLHVHFKHLMTL
ncbi:uncharacterized protein LOC111044464 [Nilaparvata lugens]|uniref:uncharacterized protein LOC111044464 n=1 Tax=Nilaparvata lugens TaxID=108931 RepID=UPI00193D75DF|nr:uncharacterized protein LOC111044464 [Nilaparvata lugens]